MSKKYEPEKGFIKSLSQKRGSSTGLFFCPDGKMLLLKPVYRKDGWYVPGGVIEDFESPKQCLERECMEEIGFIPDISSLIGLEYIVFDRSWGRDEKYNFVFIGNLVEGFQNNLKPKKQEILNWGMFSTSEVETFLIEPLKGVYSKLSKSNFSEFIYLESKFDQID